MQIVVEHLGNLAIPGHFRELTWLSLEDGLNSIPMLSVLEALHNLPNLQFLRLFRRSWADIPEMTERIEDPKSILILPKLTVLISNISLLHLIHAPKLLYLDITPQYTYPVDFPNNQAYDRLCGFDLSKITHICCRGMEGIHGSSPPHITTWGLTGDRRHKTHSASQFLPRRYRDNNGLDWIFNDNLPASDLDYPNEFYLSFNASDLWKRLPTIIPVLNLYIKKATNLVEIVLSGIHSPFRKETEIESLSMALRNATTVRYLIVLSPVISLQSLCDLLSDRDLLPNLERLSYTYPFIRKEERFSSDIPKSLRGLKERLTCTKGFEIELKDFRSIQLHDLEEIEKLGVLRREEIPGGCFNFFISRE
ncbi:hypothetical protein Clacol_010434 [Clathrus columnatus]|uniref:F-box domain-containing protein n=1 Tax=Clathrus columnatus TaxID=1419009 RepID=A0AAV5ANG8_9AGAM|nr:hypothetical protein Clacol_010434 [Clathrus columnatus]